MYTSGETTFRHIIYSKKQDGKLWDWRCPFTYVFHFLSNCSLFLMSGVIFYFFYAIHAYLSIPDAYIYFLKNPQKPYQYIWDQDTNHFLNENCPFPSDVPLSDETFKILLAVPLLFLFSPTFFLWPLGEIFGIFLLLCHHESKPTFKFYWSNLTLSKLLLASSYAICLFDFKDFY